MKRVQFSSSYVPYLFLAPQLAVIFIFFYWPSVQAIHSSFYIEDPFGFGASFVGLANYSDAIFSPEYLSIAKFTVVFTVLVTFFSLALGLLLAVKADAVIRGASAYKTMLISVYAIAPPVAGLIGMMFFDQHIGPFVHTAALFGWVVALSGLANEVAAAMLAISSDPYAILLLINLLLLIVGMFMDAGPAILILGPILAPIAQQLGIDPVHFALVMCINLTIGLATPPVGLVLFTP